MSICCVLFSVASIPHPYPALGGTGGNPRWITVIPSLTVLNITGLWCAVLLPLEPICETLGLAEDSENGQQRLWCEKVEKGLI